jgi:hypothetical protein
MSQTTLDDDELFGEAANEMRTDVESSLDATRSALPAADAIWTVEADNTLGVLNSLHSALDTGDAADHLHDAKKWYTMGERAGAFDDAADLREEIEELETVIEDITDTHDQVGDLTSTIPELRGELDSLDSTDESGEDESGEEEEEESESEAKPELEPETDDE